MSKCEKKENIPWLTTPEMGDGIPISTISGASSS